MKLTLDYNKASVIITIKYEINEWKILEDFYKENKLEYYKSYHVFGDMVYDVYRYVSVSNSICSISEYRIEGDDDEIYYIQFVDDINKGLVSFIDHTLYINIAMYRIVPKCYEHECITRIEYPIDVYVPYKILSFALIESAKAISKILRNKKLKYRIEVVTT